MVSDVRGELLGQPKVQEDQLGAQWAAPTGGVKIAAAASGACAATA